MAPFSAISDVVPGPDPCQAAGAPSGNMPPQ